MTFGVTLGLDATSTFILVALAGVVPLAILGWVLLLAIGALYRARAISDQSIMIDSVWLMFALIDALALASEGTIWLLAPLGAFVLYKIVALIGFALIRPRADRPAPKLLLLRVFSLGKRSATLFDQFAKLWRHTGPIRMIAGPDLATTTIEPHEFLNFVGGRLSRRFIANAETLDQRLAETAGGAEFDGRYRVGDLYCHDDTWTMALARLVEESDAVLMDLRGFTPANKGCTFEIAELINLAPLSRVVFVTDKTTDETFLRATINEAWAHAAAASPNREGQAQARIFDLEGAARVPDLIRHVAAASAA